MGLWADPCKSPDCPNGTCGAAMWSRKSPSPDYTILMWLSAPLLESISVVANWKGHSLHGWPGILNAEHSRRSVIAFPLYLAGHSCWQSFVLKTDSLSFSLAWSSHEDHINMNFFLRFKFIFFNFEATVISLRFPFSNRSLKQKEGKETINPSFSLQWFLCLYLPPRKAEQNLLTTFAFFLTLQPYVKRLHFKEDMVWTFKSPLKKFMMKGYNEGYIIQSCSWLYKQYLHHNTQVVEMWGWIYHMSDIFNQP